MRLIITNILVFVGFTSIFAQKPYRGAEVYSNTTVQYGKFVMSMKMISGSGMLSTFFIYKNDSYMEGVYWEEIDVEVLGKNDATVLSTNIITDGVSDNTDQDVEEIEFEFSLAEDYHTFTVEWTPDSVVWYVDEEMVRSASGENATSLTSNASLRFNAWISCSVAWAGALNPSDLPKHQYVDWIEYYSYSEGEFTLQWRDDFDTFDAGRWSKANWTFECNEVDFTPDNAYIEDGKLVLAITDPNPEGLYSTNNSDFLEIINNNSSGEIQVRLFEYGYYHCQIIDLQGRTILIKEFVGDSLNIPCTNLNSGIYLLTVNSDNISATEKIYIE
ncbi:MAG: family 16 glycosylhydrolase [Bacteroidales bacterium]|nr:family 16 glycosylhydrolase [Bacteroidales bacterium]